MGKGKGYPSIMLVRKPNNIFVDGVSEEVAKEVLYKASAKLPLKQNLLGDNQWKIRKKIKLTKDRLRKIQSLKKIYLILDLKRSTVK